MTRAFDLLASLPLLGGLALACASGPQPSARDTADANDTGQVVPARSASEQNILARVGDLPTGVARAFGDATVIADAAYASAASGRTCRSLRIGRGQSTTRQRVACTEGQGWFFVPDVLGTDGDISQ